MSDKHTVNTGVHITTAPVCGSYPPYNTGFYGMMPKPHSWWDNNFTSDLPIYVYIYNGYSEGSEYEYSIKVVDEATVTSYKVILKSQLQFQFLVGNPLFQHICENKLQILYRLY